jgi:hypothetical protein
METASCKFQIRRKNTGIQLTASFAVKNSSTILYVNKWKKGRESRLPLGRFSAAVACHVGLELTVPLEFLPIPDKIKKYSIP